MKKFFVVFLSLILLLSGCSAQQNSSINTQPFIESENKTSDEPYVKSVWITYYELGNMIKNRNENEFKKEVKKVLKTISEIGFNTVTIQVRAFADAFYKSKYFPASKYCCNEQGSELKYDVLEIFCNEAKEKNMRVEAWINPYRVSFDNKIEDLSSNSIARKWYENKKTKSNVYISKNGIYFNPASKKVKELIANGAEEIAENYEVHAIHFDDYFYPSKSKKIDSKEYVKYKKKGGEESLADFRRGNVNEMIKSVYSSIKKVNKEIKFGISPAANIKNDYSDLYADVERWAKEDGFCDYICPQIYFGFKNVYQPFMFTTKKWIGITSKDLYVGLPLYKAGKKDKYAAEEDKKAINEFINNDNIIARQINYLAKIDDVKGFYIFSYSSLLDESCKKEVENMLEAMQNSNQD